jgi:hypothetical protein
MMSRFSLYAEKVFGLSARIEGLRDSRKNPQIPAASVFLSAMMMFAAGLKSLNALESELRVPRRWERIVGKCKPSADTIGRVMGLTDPECLRDILSDINHRLRRNKALDDNPWPLRFAVLDGHEFFSQLQAFVSPLLEANGHH